jgi:hypothetical protein
LVTRLTPEEKLELIERLARENEEARERIAELERKRLEDPSFDLADRRLTDDASDLCFTAAVEPAEGPPVEKSSGNGLLMFRMGPENALAPAPAGNTDWSAWESWMQGHLNVLRSEVADTISRATGIALASTRKEMQAEFERKLAALKTENAELKGLLDSVLAKCSELEGTIKTLTADFKAESGVRDGLVRAFELQIAEMRGRLSAVLRDYST